MQLPFDANPQNNNIASPINQIQAGFWYPDKVVASNYSISRSTLWAWVSAGKFPAPYKIGDRSTRWSGTDLVEWERSIRNKQ